MSENLRRFQQSLYAFDAVVRRVPDDQWDAQSPCADWTAREVVGHVMWGPTALAAALRGEDTPADMTESERAGGDPVAAWTEVLDAGLAELDRPGAIQTVAKSPFGEMPVDDMLGFFYADPVMHAWDLAQAAGIEHGIRDELADQVTTLWENAGDVLRGPGMLGPVTEAPADADAAGRMAAVGGRDVS